MTADIYAHAKGAEAYLRAHPELIGSVVGHAEALEMADFAFGSLLSGSEPEPHS